MKRKLKKTLALVLTILMASGLMPMEVMAAATQTSAELIEGNTEITNGSETEESASIVDNAEEALPIEENNAEEENAESSELSGKVENEVDGNRIEQDAVSMEAEDAVTSNEVMKTAETEENRENLEEEPVMAESEGIKGADEQIIPTSLSISQSIFDIKLNELRSKYPDYSTWTDYYDGGHQCWGFARLVADYIFGESWRNWTQVNSISNVKAGDILQYGNTSGSGHTVFVTSVSGNTITFVDCNGDGNYSGGTKVRTCGIKWDNTISKSNLMFNKYSFSYLLSSPGISDSGNTNGQKLNVSISGNQVYFNWEPDSNAASYNMKVWKNKIYEGDMYTVEWGVKSTSCAFALPAGTYQAYVDAINSNYCVMSNVVEFTVGNTSPKLTANVSGNQVYFSWESISGATSYKLLVYQGKAWQSDVYEAVWSTTETNAAMALPAGTYQAYVDASGDEGYLQMGNVIEFIVGETSPKLTANVSGNQVHFVWEAIDEATSYKLLVYRGKAWQSDVYEAVWSTTETDATIALPVGSYQAYVDASGDNGYLQMGNVIEFSVENISVTDCTIQLENNIYFYDGTEKKPVVIVKDIKEVLNNGIDYIVSYANNITPGIATVTITGVGNYTGTVIKEFMIKEAEQPDPPFTDIEVTDYFYTPVLWAYKNGITSGIDLTHFGADTVCTRAQVAVFLWRANGQPEPAHASNPFMDVSSSDYYYKAVMWAAENGITSGLDSTHFAPDETVTRGQFVTFLHRAEGKLGYSIDNPFEDILENMYYYDAVLWAYENGITSGLDATHFAPDEVCTRGQVVTFLYRAYH